MKHLGIFLIYILAIAGCGKSDDVAMENFKKNKPLSKDGGLKIPNGDFAKFSIAADTEVAAARIEISSGGHCFAVSGAIPVKLIEGQDANGQYWQSEGLKVQINPKQNDRLKYNNRFVHFVVDRKKENRIPCSEAPKEAVSVDEFRSKMQRTLFSNLPLTERQLALASQTLHRGSSTFMLFFKNHNIGLVFDSATKDLIGIDVPKQVLESDFVFTSNRDQLQTDQIPEDEFFPLMMTEEDIRAHQQAMKIVNLMSGIEERLKDKSPQERDFIVSGTWAHLVQN